MSGSLEKIKLEKRAILKNYLDEYNGRSHSILSQNHDAIFVLDLDGYFVQVNAAFEKLLGCTCEDVIQTKFQTLIPMEDLSKVLNFFHKTALGQFENFDCKWMNNPAEHLNVNVMFIPLTVQDEVVGVIGILKDISHLKRNYQEIKKIEGIYRSLAENVLDVIVSINMLGEIQYITPSCEKILGFTPADLMGKHFTDLFIEEDLDKALLDFKWVFTVQNNGRATYRLFKKNGSFVWVEVQCKPVIDPVTQNTLEIVCVIREITKQRKMEEVIRSRKKAFRDIIEHSPDGVVIIRNLKIIFMNKTAIELLGVSSKTDFINKSIFDFIHPDYHQISLERANHTADGGKTDFLEFKLLRTNGAIMDAEIKGIPTIFQGSNATCIFIRDLTEAKKTQRLQLETEKLKISGQLAGGIVHEVRNPLKAMKEILHQLELEWNGRKAPFEIIKAEMERIDFILSKLVTLAEPKELNLEAIDFQNILEDVKNLIVPKYDENRLFHNAFLHAPIGKVIILPTGKFLTVNPSFCKFVGYSMRELLEIDFQTITHPEDIEPDVTNLKRMLNGEFSSFEMEKRFIHNDKRIIWGLLSCSLVRDKEGSPLFAISQIVDITSRKQAEQDLVSTMETLKKSNHLLEIISNHSQDIISITDPNGLTEYISPAVTRILGYERDEVLNQPITQFWHSDDIEKFAQSTVRSKSGQGTFECRIQHKDGSYIPFETSVKVVRNSEGTIEQIVGIGRDMSERNQAMHYMVLSEKLSIVSQLAAGIAHEIRNPLTAIKGFTNLIKEKLGAADYYPDIIIEEIVRIEQIVNELLFLAKPKTTEWTEKNIHVILHQVTALLQAQALLHNIKLTEKYLDEEVIIRCDENSLKQVFINVIKNGIEAMSNGGEIQIVTNLEKDEIVIQFIDQGCGIPQEMLSKIGTPFYTTKENGTGLGVMISHSIIENHNGHLDIQSELNKGTVFTVSLPRSAHQ